MIGGFTSSASVSASSSEAELSSPRPGETRTVRYFKELRVLTVSWYPAFVAHKLP